MADRLVEIAGATRPYPGETTNGDAWAVSWQGDVCRITVVDGLGHGPRAAEAATAALAALADRPDLGPVEALRMCHAALAKTRGAAASVAWIDVPARRIVYAGIGNVEARLWQDGRDRRLIAYRGVVGAVLPRSSRAFELDLAADWLLLVHTDGVSTRFAMEAPREAEARGSRELAEWVLAEWGRATDDATVVVARGRYRG